MPPGDPDTRSVFVDPSGRRAGRLRWLGRSIALVGLAYLVILGGSFARAPWAPHLSLPGIGSITPPALKAAPPSLGAQALRTPAPVVSAGSGTSGPAPGPSQGNGGSGGSRPGTPTTTRSPGGTATTSPPTTTTTTFGPPGQTRRSTTTTTSAAGSTTTTSTRGRPSTTTTTNVHRRGAVAQP